MLTDKSMMLPSRLISLFLKWNFFRPPLLCRDYKGKNADRLVTGIDPGVVSLVAELRGHERQAAEEVEQWKTRVRSPR
jgi:hypothetical protein